MSILSKSTEWLLEKITDARPVKRIDGDQGQPYLERAFLFSVFGVTAYLHRFVGDDPDYNLHDHPWGWSFSIVLLGRYIERFLCGPMVMSRHIRWFNWIPGYRFHRIGLNPLYRRQRVWTLFVHGPRVKGWGFMELPDTTSGTMVYEYHYRFFTAYSSGNGPGWHKIAKKGRDIKRYRRQ